MARLVTRSARRRTGHVLAVALLLSLVPAGHVAHATAEEGAAPVADCPQPRSPTLPRISGPDRVVTAAAATRDVVGDVDTVVVVGASGYVDATVGAVLAATLEAPLLLTDRAGLSPAAREALGRLDRDGDGGRAFVVGGGAVVSGRVDDALRASGFPVTRVAGEDRYGTATAATRHAYPDGAERSVVTSGDRWPELVAAAALAAATGAQLVLTPVGDASAAARQVAGTDTTVVGSTDVVSARAFDQLAREASRAGRVAGGSPTATVARVAGLLGDRPAVVATAGDWPDAVVAAATAARRGTAVLLAADPVDAITAATLGGRTATIVGGTAAVPPPLAGDLADIAAGTRGAPYPVASPPGCTAVPGTVGRATTVRVTLDRGGWDGVAASSPSGASVDVQVSGATATVTVVAREAGPVAVAFEGRAVAGEASRRVVRGWVVEAVPDAVRSPEGWLIAGGSGPVVGTGGRTVRYTVEIADGLERRQDLAAFAAFAERVLSDPGHGWTARGAHRLQRVSDPSVAQVRVLLATPAHVDRQCAKAGLRTAGIYSCWNGRFAALNSDRWFHGVGHVSDQELYRTYLVNHEVGHGLGHGHRSCPARGALAPVMMQLTKSTYGCRPNGWPYP